MKYPVPTPTNLEIKQICNGGQYAILKEQLNTTPVVRYTNCGPNPYVTFVRKVPSALFDLERLQSASK